MMQFPLLAPLFLSSIWTPQHVSGFCNSTNTSLAFECYDYDGEFPLSGSDSCVPNEWVCDGYRDCPFGDDEWNCPTYTDCVNNGGFACDNQTCIRFKYTCLADPIDDIWDCPNQIDVSRQVCLQNPNYTGVLVRNVYGYDHCVKAYKIESSCVGIND